MSENNFYNVTSNLSDDCSANNTGLTMRCKKCGAPIHSQQRFCTECGNPIVKKTDSTVGLPVKSSKKKIIIPIVIACSVLVISVVVGVCILIYSNSITHKMEGDWDTLGKYTYIDRYDYKEVSNDYVFVEIGIQSDSGYLQYWDKGMMMKESVIDQVGVSYFRLGDGNTLIVEKPSPNSITGREKKDLFSGVYQYSEAAMLGDKDTWYLDGDTLYINGYTLYRINDY